MLRTCRRIHFRFLAHTYLALLLFLVCASTVWGIPPAVAFNAVATVLDTGSAALNHPEGVTVDSAGNVYIADTAHHQIVRVTPDGNASAVTITGLSTGLSAPEGLALDD